MKLSFQKSVAVHNTLAAGIIIAFAYVGIYAVAYNTDYNHLDNDLRQERLRMLNMLRLKKGSIVTGKLFTSPTDIESRANPVLIQVADKTGRIIYQSVNAPAQNLIQYNNGKSEMFSDITISGAHFRLGIFPVLNDNGEKTGVASIAISGEESWIVLRNLLLVLCLSYPLVMVGLYFFLLLSVTKAVMPIRNLIKAASGINDTNISMRLPLPDKKDDIYQLAATINELLDRIEKSMKNQKQFTADASHEMRTPLSAIRGILEVLIRRKREPEHYERAIKEAIAQADKMHLLLEQLLQLARLNAGVVATNFTTINLHELIIAIKDKWKEKLDEKRMNLSIDIPVNKEILSDSSFLAIIIENLLSNAIKYGKEAGSIDIQWHEQRQCISVSDDGIGISPEHLPHLFERFYRTDNSRNSKVPGYGLGLALVDKVAHLLNIRIGVASTEGVGTCFSLYFRISS